MASDEVTRQATDEATLEEVEDKLAEALIVMAGQGSVPAASKVLELIQQRREALARDDAYWESPEGKLKRAIQLRAWGHSLRYIGRRIDTPHQTLAVWFARPAVADEISQIARDLPDEADDARRAREVLLSMLEADKEHTRQRAAEILLANRARTMAAAGVKKLGDAAEATMPGPEEIAAAEQRALDYVAQLEAPQDGDGD